MPICFFVTLCIAFVVQYLRNETSRSVPTVYIIQSTLCCFFLCGWQANRNGWHVYKSPESAISTYKESRKNQRNRQLYSCITRMKKKNSTSFVVVWFGSTPHCKKSLAIFPTPGGMSLTKLSMAWKIFMIPGRGELGKWHPGWGRENR